MKKILVCVSMLMFTVGIYAESPADKSAGSALPAPTVDSSTYEIGAQDVIQVSVWKEQDLSATLPVRPDGYISMPLLHDVKAAGFTPNQLAADIRERLKKYIQDPQVSVIVTAVNSQRVFLLGEVLRPGPLNMASGMTTLQAISSAGGLTQFANAKRIYILRNEQGSPHRIAFRYKEALKGVENQDIALKPGDTIVVP